MLELKNPFKRPNRPIMKVCMMGPKAVGKTTILTAVFKETQQKIVDTSLNLVALGDTNSNLIERERKLMAMFRNKSEVIDSAANRVTRPLDGIEATYNETTFDFSFGFIGKDPIVDLVIKDFPGEMVVNNSEKVIDFIKESQAIFIAIDTPHLMENNGEYNIVKNKPSEIIELFKKALKEKHSEKLVVLIPLKCEKYFYEERMTEVLEKINKEYDSLSKLFKEDKNICCTVAPILTLGNVDFDRFSYTENNTIKLAPDDCPEDVLYKYVRANKYAPLFCSQPLYALLSFVAAQYTRIKKKGNFWDNFMNWIWNDIFKNNQELYSEIVKIDKLRLQEEKYGYKILCGEHLFHYNY